MIPKGKPIKAVTKYVIIILLPAVVCEKQNLTCSSLLTLSKKGIYCAIANIHKTTINQNVPLNCFKSFNFILYVPVSEY